MLNYPIRRLARLPQALTYIRPSLVRTKRTVARDDAAPSEVVQKSRIRSLNGEPDPVLFEDHRKPWFYTIRGISNFLILPTVFLYAVFFYDWGDRDHVFSEPRRWLDRQKATFFSLSPEERALASTEEGVPGTVKDAQTNVTEDAI